MNMYMWLVQYMYVHMCLATLGIVTMFIVVFSSLAVLPACDATVGYTCVNVRLLTARAN